MVTSLSLESIALFNLNFSFIEMGSRAAATWGNAPRTDFGCFFFSDFPNVDPFLRLSGATSLMFERPDRERIFRRAFRLPVA